MTARFSNQHELPPAMQGTWADQNDGSTLAVSGASVLFQGVPVRHDWYEVEEVDGSLCDNFKVDDPSRFDGFVKENLTHLVIDPEGNFHGYNTKFGCTFVRTEVHADD